MSFLFRIVSTAKVTLDSRPQRTPRKVELSRSKLGMIKNTPARQNNEKKIFILIIFSLRNRGSRNVVNTG